MPSATIIPVVSEREQQRIIVVVQDGFVVGVYCDDPDGTEVEIRDYDTQEETGFVDEKGENINWSVVQAEPKSSLPKIRSV